MGALRVSLVILRRRGRIRGILMRRHSHRINWKTSPGFSGRVTLPRLLTLNCVGSSVCVFPFLCWEHCWCIMFVGYQSIGLMDSWHDGHCMVRFSVILYATLQFNLVN